jgi:hypothetical protein
MHYAMLFIHIFIMNITSISYIMIFVLHSGDEASSTYFFLHLVADQHPY